MKINWFKINIQEIISESLLYHMFLNLNYYYDFENYIILGLNKCKDCNKKFEACICNEFQNKLKINWISENISTKNIKAIIIQIKNLSTDDFKDFNISRNTYKIVEKNIVILEKIINENELV